jgi:hypothetical protein
MKAAIIAPKRTFNSKLLNDISKKTGGDVLKIIGKKNRHDLNAYDKAVFVYQYKLSPLRDEFIDFCNDNKNQIRDAVLVIDVAMDPSVDQEPIQKYRDELDSIVLFFSSVFKQVSPNETAVVRTDYFGKDVQRKYAEMMGLKYTDVFDGRTFSDNSIIVIFSSKPDMRLEISEKRASAYMLVGLAAVTLAIFFICVVIVYDTFLAMGRTFGLFLAGPLLAYTAYKTRNYAYWKGK